MTKNHFTIIIPSYNCENWVEGNLNSALRQDYDNYDVVYVDDCSTDGTLAAASSILESSEKKFEIVSNKTNRKALYNLYTQILKAKEGSIIITLDGDDMLAGTDVLSYLNQVYQNSNCWMTVGSYIQNDNYQVVSPRVSPEYWNSNIRKVPWSFSHLRTFRRELFMRIDRQHLLDTDGEFFKCTFDRAMMYPMVEMSGQEKVGLIGKVLYIYNRHNPISVDRVHRYDQLRIEAQISEMTPYQKIESL